MKGDLDIVVFDAELHVVDFVEACEVALAAHALGGLPPVVGWRQPPSGVLNAKGLGTLAGGRFDVSMLDPSRTPVRFELAGELHVDCFRPKGAKTFTASLTAVTGGWAASRRLESFHHIVSFARALALAGAVQRGASRWVGGAAECLPQVPLAGSRAQVVLVRDGDAEAEYDDPKVFWDAWDEVTWYGDVALCVRALDAADGPTLLERIQDSQWALVRAAKPGRTKYWFPRPTDREKPIYRRGERHLQVVGHDPRTGLMELSCVLGPGEHIQGWEIDDLRFAIHSKRIKRRKLTETRVVFLDREAAEREKRPLLDIGARVFVQEAQGDVEILG